MIWRCRAVSLDVPCLRSCSISMPVSSSSPSDSSRCPARCLLLASRAFPMAALSRAASLVLFDVLSFRLFAASLCHSTHRSDRRCLQPLPQLHQCPWARDSAESSSHRHVQRRDSSVQGTCWGLRQLSATPVVIILFSAATCSLCFASCSATRGSMSLLNRCSSPMDFALDGVMMPAMDAASSTADFGRYHLFSCCHALRPDPGNACSTRRTSVPTSPVVVVINHDANAQFEC